MAALEKVYKCLSCDQDIKLERKSDGSGWLKWNLDGTNHLEVKKSKQQQPQQQLQAVAVDDGPQIQIAELTKQVSDLKETVNVLISQIQMLRSEVVLYQKSINIS